MRAIKRNLILLGTVAVLVLCLVCFADIESVDEYYMSHMEDITENSETVTITIRCDTILDNYDKLAKPLRSEQYVPSDGVILAETEYVLRQGDTVFDILDRACRYNKIQMEYQGADANRYNTVYVQGINHLYEFSCGRLSGWIYKVNDEPADRGASAYKLKNGDSIAWLYTCDLGRDVGAGVEG